MEEKKFISDVGNVSSINYSLQGGKAMANFELEDAIVITGISGTFPNCRDVHEYRDNLFNKVNNMSTKKRWDLVHPEIPTRLGVVPYVDNYDPGFFGVHERQSQSMDPMISMLQEKSVEAIFDAGLHPSDLENTRTGVYIGASFSENEKTWFFDNLKRDTYAITGSQRSMTAHRISYFLKLKGPSHVVDTACSSSMYAFEHAYRALRLGEIDNAIIGGANLCLSAFASMQFFRLGVLSKDGFCKVFDAEGNGYARSEAIGVLFLQKAKHAKRIYCEVVHAKTNCDGYKEQGITFPSKDAQRELLTEFYDECDVDRHSLSFLEAHGTGTSAGDPEECFAIDDVFTKERKRPLLIGSVKSNIGHSETVSGVCSIIKCIIGMETGYIPPNIHYNMPRPEIKGLVEGRMKVVTEKTPFENNLGLIGVNGYGFGGANCHLLLRRNKNAKIAYNTTKDNVPRLVCVSGRTKESVTKLINSVIFNKFDTEYIKLLHNSFRINVENHQYRGYTITCPSGEILRSTNLLKYFALNSKPLHIVFGELNNWYKIGCDLINLPLFFSSIQKIQNILMKKVNILDLFLKKTLNKEIGYILGNVVVQLCLINTFRKLEIKPTSNLAYSVGELISAYYNETLSLEDAVNYAFYIDKSISNITQTLESSINWENIDDIKDIISTSLCVDDSISNTNNSIDNGVDILNDFRTNLSNKSFSWIKNSLFQNLSEQLGLKDNEESKRLKMIVNAIINNVTLTGDVVSNSVIIKIADGKLDELEVSSFVNFFGDADNYLVELLKGLGRLYELGYNFQIGNLYPSVKFPVTRGTEMISPYIKWNHRKLKYIPKYNTEMLSQHTVGGKMIKIEVDDHAWSYIKGHIVDGRNLFPATGYLYLIWKTFSIMNNMPIENMQVCFENCKFIRAVAVPKKGYFLLYISIQFGSGNFEVVEADSVVVRGRITLLNKNMDNEEWHQSDAYNYFTEDNTTLKFKDIYKELKLRGYDYKGEFRAIQECNINATKSYIKWEDNWVTFIDNMLQMKILQTDSRLLYVPIFISKITISAKKHLEVVNERLVTQQNVPILPVTSDEITGQISCGGINIWGLIVSSIPRRKIMNVPVLENYKFIPNIAVLNIQQSVRVNIQIIIENTLTDKIKSVELIDDFSKENDIPLTPIIKSVLNDQPLVQPFLKILSKISIEDTTIETEDKKLKTETDCLLVIGTNVLERADVMEEAYTSLVENGFLITRESHQYNISKNVEDKFEIYTVHKILNQEILLLRKRAKINQSKYVKINYCKSFSWITEVQNSVIQEKNADVILYVENKPKSGILGLLNCLRLEVPNKHVRCVFLVDKTEHFNPQLPFYSNQLKKHMSINVYKKGQWGTYRHLLLEKKNEVEAEHCFLNVMRKGDLSSLQWIEGPLCLDTKKQPEKGIISVYYGALNFRDIMTALGKISVDVITRDRLMQECVQGFEFSGRNSKGRRVMGMIAQGALSTLILNDSYLTFPIPNSWSLEEAATVPVVYGTVIYALIIRGQMIRGESILIHSGTGGIGQAAIKYALHYGCTVFTTVGTKEKRDFLKTIFPQLKDYHIGNSHDESFEQLILSCTNGRGVDIVLNSLAEDKLITSIRCLAKGGRFIEIGKFDMANNHHLNCLLFQKEVSFHGIMLDHLFHNPPLIKQKINEIMTKDIESGVIEPLNRTVFKYNEVEQAFRFMATGEHMGKVLIQLRKPETDLVVLPTPTKFLGYARYFCNPEKVYIIAGGLGELGLELADWLILRGAKILVLSSRKGVTNDYQSYRLSIWKTYGVMVKILTAPITTREGCKLLIEESSQLGPIDAVFNLAAVLSDSLFEDQTPEKFITSFEPKAYATQYLDEFTRQLCPNLNYFVVFSSMSCGRGTIGQSNYGMANSVMERICENRKQEGYPALAIAWGAIGEVGMVARMSEDNKEIKISGTSQQNISSCFEIMDIFLQQKEASVVSSIVVAEKSELPTVDNVIDAITNILGLHDSKSISLHSTLAEMGMDSMTAVEIKQVLERDFEIFFSAKDVRNMTFAKLKTLQNKELSDYDKEQDIDHNGIDVLVRLIGDTVNNSNPYVQMTSKVAIQNADAPTVLLFPGVEGFASIYQGFTEKLNAHTISTQFSLDEEPKSIVELAQSVLPIVEKFFPNNTFTFVAYSYGTLIALELVNILECRGYKGTLICIDGSPMFMKKMMLSNFDTESERNFETTFLCHVLSFYISAKFIDKHKETIFKCSTWDDRVNVVNEIIKHSSIHEVDYQKRIFTNIYYRCKSLLTYTPSYSKLTTNVKLIKARQSRIKELPEDYELSQYLESPLEVYNIDGNHFTILENDTVPAMINTYICHGLI